MTPHLQIEVDRSKGISLILLSTLFFSLMNALVKHVGSSLPAIEVAFFRALVNAVVLFPVMLHKKIPFFGFNRRILFTRSVAGFVALTLTFYVAARLKLSDAIILQNMAVVFVALLSVFILKERVSAKLVGLISLAFVGASLVLKPNFDVLNVTGLVGLLGAFFSAIAYVSIKKLHDSEHSLTIVFNFAIYSTVIGGTALIFYFVPPSGGQLGSLLLMGGLGACGQVCMTRAFSYAPASVLTPYNFAMILFGALLGLFFWDEVPDLWSMAGALLIVLAGVGIVRTEVQATA